MKITAFQKATLAASMIMFIIAGCSTPPKQVGPVSIDTTAAQTTKNTGAYYMDDGPADLTPDNLDHVPDAVPRQEPLHRYANRPYTKFGKEYVPHKTIKPYEKTGKASWYGKKFHGKKTASGEPYNMFAMTAAHPTLPIPSYAKITNPKNNRHVIVRINDRGPFHSNRIIDLSYTAAHRLGFVRHGSATVHVEQIVFDDDGDPIGLPVIEALPAPPVLDEQSGITYIQVGAYRIRDNADTMGLNLKYHFEGLANRTQVVKQQDLFRVWIGPFDIRDDAVFLADKISQRYGFKAILIDK